MPGRISFAFANQAVAPVGGAVSRINEESLRKQGFELSSTQGPPKYHFSRMGWWNPNVRSSIVRVPLMKLMGTGIASALLALSPHVGRYLGFSLALSAAVNFVASYFYYRIWQLRAQLFGGSKYDRWTAVVGRDVGTTAADEEGSLLKPASSKEQDEHDKHVIYWQETMVDGQRYSDWVCTLGRRRPPTLTHPAS